MTTIRPESAKHVLLICSVGGTPEPIAAAIRHWRPARITFLCSEQTRASIDAALELAENADAGVFSPGCTDQTILRDPQDIRQTLRDLRALDQSVPAWQQRGDEYGVVIDFTGGTKVMSAALGLVARRWKCTFAYVGGHERSKDGVGVVASGHEQLVSLSNPWDALGYQAVEDAVTVFNHGGYAAAAQLLDRAMKNTNLPEVKRELSTLKSVVDAYSAWDRFDHKTAAKSFEDALKNRNDLAAMFPLESAALIARLEQHRERVAQLAGQKEPAAEWVMDLLHNARRRAAECRFDDAVARLYRAFEALAQVRLREQHKIADTKSVTLEMLPDSLRADWANRGRSSGEFALGLQDSYRVLKELGDDLGRKFNDAGLADSRKSPLVARNQSILAHGFQPVGKNVYDALAQELNTMISGAAADSQDWRLPAPS